MTVFNQILILAFFVFFFGVYRFFKNKKRCDSQISTPESDSISYLSDIDIANEERVRKNWLISFFIFSAMSSLSILLSLIGDGLSELPESTGSSLGLLFGIAISILAITPWFWITYHCSYKKRGTAWLVWTMIMLPLREISDLVKGGWNQAAEWDAFGWAIVLIFLGIEIFYWVNCQLLLRVNSSRKDQKIKILKENMDPA